MLPILALTVLTPAADAVTLLEVCAKGCPYTSLEDALDAANDGDTIHVHQGTYTAKLDLDGDNADKLSVLTVIAVDYPLTTTLAPPNGVAVKAKKGASLIIEGFTIRPGDNRAMEVDEDAYLQATDIEVAPTTMAKNGIGLKVHHSALAVLDNVRFEGLVANDGKSGAAIKIKDPGSTLIGTDVVFSGCSAEGDGGAVHAQDSIVELIRPSFNNDSSDKDGGAIYADGATIFLDNPTVTSCTAEFGGGVFSKGDSEVSISGGSFTSCISDIEGAAVFGDSVHIDIDGTSFDSNFALGDGVVFGSSSLVLIEDATFTNNSGSAIWLETSPTTSVTGSVFDGNLAIDSGGAIRLDGTQAKVFENEFRDNTAPTGGALALHSVQEAEILGNLFCANNASMGAGLYGEDGGNGVQLTNNLIIENSATAVGGGVYLVEPTGGAAWNNHILGNSAGGNGGGIALESGTFTVRNNLIAHTSSGHGLTASGMTPDLDYNGWWDNSASDATGVSVGAHSVSADPLLTSYSLDGDCDNDDYMPTVDSPLLDAGDPAEQDPDGSRSDIGAFGGPWALGDWDDADGDGSVAMWDCDDDDPLTYPGAAEVCDGVDNDCDGTADEGLPIATYYEDTDSDGFGNAAVAVSDCGPPPGYVEDATDCDDADGAVNPDADEVCNGVDDDCSGAIDDNAIDADLWYRDNDGDGVGHDKDVTRACSQPTGYVATSGDCDDDDANTYPGAAELCDGIDNDCDGVIDDDVVVVDWYPDDDGDGYGAHDAEAVPSCAEPKGHVQDAEDCDDTNPDIHPSAIEVCNGYDDDCDGDVDDDDDGVDAPQWHADTDGDGFGDASAPLLACDEPAGHVEDATDCDDTSADTYPGAPELCDEADNDCDGEIDESVTDLTWYLDADGDGFGDDSETLTRCDHPTGYVLDPGDCDDADPTVNPDAEEVWYDGVDQDCDGGSDYDQDGDGYDAEDWGDDCDDTDPTVNPDATDVAGDGVDQDCDGQDAQSSDPTDTSSSRDWQPPTDVDTASDNSLVGCACSASGSPAGVAWLLLPMAFAARRRAS